ncbi:unnamed protein product [Cuscuta epithymum]|uniref:Uncharacterized protein n=1 Tax=Cuscuta epithymum TaxID=186058 RepID=A0AAV0CLY8_9ASTE|nr:unnamed protein product [Cuscuta epithymum]
MNGVKNSKLSKVKANGSKLKCSSIGCTRPQDVGGEANTSSGETPKRTIITTFIFLRRDCNQWRIQEIYLLGAYVKVRASDFHKKDIWNVRIIILENQMSIIEHNEE